MPASLTGGLVAFVIIGLVIAIPAVLDWLTVGDPKKTAGANGPGKSRPSRGRL